MIQIYIPSLYATDVQEHYGTFSSGNREHQKTIIEIVPWEKHPRVGQCRVCTTINHRGRTPTAKIYRGPLNKTTVTEELPDKLFASINTTDSYNVTPLIDILGKCKDEETIFVCPICQCVLSSPSVQTLCEHNFCANCLSGWFQFNKQPKVPCPVCKASINFREVSQIPRILRLQLSVLLTVCTQCWKCWKIGKNGKPCMSPQTP